MKLPLKLLISTAFKSLFLEAAWNNQGQQNLGFAAALENALDYIYSGRPNELKGAKERVSIFFNTHPVMSGPILGVALHLEEEVSEGLVSEKTARKNLLLLSSTLASIGDFFFWYAYLPFCMIFSYWIVVALKYPSGAVLVPILFSILHLPFRFGGFYFGYKKGLNVFNLVERLQLYKWARVINKVAVFFIGLLTSLLINRIRIDFGINFFSSILFAVLIFLVTLFFMILIRRFKMMELWIYLIVGASIILSFFKIASQSLFIF